MRQMFERGGREKGEKWMESKGEGEKDRQMNRQEKHNRCACWNIMPNSYYYTAVCVFKKQDCESPQGVDAF